MLTVIFEDNHLLVVAKPAGLLVQGDITGHDNLLDMAKRHRIEVEKKSGNAFVGLVHRLDRPVTGIVVLAKTSKSASRLSEQFRKKSVVKQYVAVSELLANSADPLAGEGEHEWRDELEKNADTNSSRIARKDSSADTKEAITLVRKLDDQGRLRLLLLQPVTGRSHQLRVQSASRGLPIVGDVRYGSSWPFDGQLALHALAISFHHPTSKERLTFSCPPPPTWRKFAFDVMNLAEAHLDSKKGTLDVDT